MVENSKNEPIDLPNQIIRASAGTGKTFALSNRYLKLLVSGVDCHSILATTFSRKGAGEILDRIIHRLSDAALNDDAAAELAGQLETELYREKAAKILQQLLGNLHRLEVSTLDSFFNRVAKAFSLEIGLPPTWEIVDEQKIAQLEDESIQAVLQDETVLSLLHMLSKGEASRRVASMIRDTVRNVYLIYRESGPEAWDKLDPQGRPFNDDELLSLTQEMQAIVPKTKQLAKHWLALLETIDDSNWNAFVKLKSFQNFLAGNLKYGRTKLTPDILGVFNRLLPHCQAIISQQLIHANQSTRDLLQPFGELLEQSKDATGSLRFDDVTERLQAFVKMWDTDHFSFRLDNQIQHLLLDEFQDTSPAQWNVIEPFARKVVADSNSDRSFFCVGDMKQAIFGWRGGVAEIFDVVDDTLPNLEPLTFAKSYRSSPAVIRLVNQVFENIKNYSCGDSMIDEAVHGWGEWFSKHSTARENLKGHVTLEMAPDCDPKARSIEDRKDRLRNLNLVDATVKRVRQLARELPEDKTIGVLVRRNKEVTELIAKLREKGVQASEEGGSALTDSVSVELILSAMQLADHPGDGLARFHVSHSPLAFDFGLQPENDANAKANQSAARTGAANLRKRLIDEGYGPVVESLARKLLPQATKRETLRLQQLVRAAYDRSADPVEELRPNRFVEFIREEVKVSGQNSARVRVMTIHRSKGLEFDVVVLPYQLSSRGWSGLTPTVVVGRDSPTAPIDIATRYVGADKRALLPSHFQKLFEDDRQQNVREAMCVLYVMLTRAKHSVHIIVSHGAKADHKSPAGILMATLADGKREEGVLYSEGDADWFAGEPAKITTDDPYNLQQFYLPDQIRLQPATVDRELRSKRGLPKVLPSLVSEGDHVDLKQVFESWSNFDSLLRGRILHGCFEQLIWADEGMPRAEALQRHLQTVAPSVQDFQPFLDDFYRLLEQPKVKTLFSRRGYLTNYLALLVDDSAIGTNRVEVCTERRFAVSTTTGLLQGVIDRLVLIYRDDLLIAADIVDLKTDRFDSSQLHDRISRYRPQLQAYRTAAAKFLGLPIDQVSTRLVFVESGQIVNVHAVEGAVDYSATKKRSSPYSPKRKTPASPPAKLERPPEHAEPSQRPESSAAPQVKTEADEDASPKSVQRTLWD